MVSNMSQSSKGFQKKRLVTKNELKRILLGYTSQLPCASEACRIEKRQLNRSIKKLEDEVRAKDASIKCLADNLCALRTALREFSCFVASNYPGTKIAATARSWEKRWKMEDEEGLWNKASSGKAQQTTAVHHQSQVKPSTSAVKNAGITQIEKAQLVSPQQNNPFHEFARKNAIAISHPTSSNSLHQSAEDLEQVGRSSLTAANNCSQTSEDRTTATAHALITINQPLSLSLSSDVGGQILMSMGPQYIQHTNSTKVVKSNGTAHLPQSVNNFELKRCFNSTELKRKNRNELIGIKKMRHSETVGEIIVLSDDESDVKKDIIVENVITIPRYKSINTVRCKKSHPLVYPKLKIYPGLRISRLHIAWANSAEDLTKTKCIMLNIRYAGEYSKQIFHILYYIRSMVENGEAEGWTKIYSKECEPDRNSRLRIQFDEDQTWFNDAIYFTGFIECGLERYGAYADVCKVELGEQNKEMSVNL